METNQNNQPNAYQVKDDDNLEEKDLKRPFLFGGEDDAKTGDEPGMEGSPAGGQRFGHNSNTPSGDDKNNPSQLVGNNNGYMSRTEPSDEHPENNNFKDASQLGQPNYTQAADAANTGQSDTENTGPQKDNNEDKGNYNEAGLSYQEGTADGDDVNIPGTNEIPDRQKVAE
ncbi:hypothetical protein [Mucilaginibacter psychrotolerans]|uniref:Uncharacterized protein n=1 Tax=Mucilaginibacter psychrotolerans TaxID=1524096 RepID=A0A4Y8RXL6_9SPHI|nr:hypothetical protein [Mucilaginibacter psychrotolerans]TFF30407.1 hypothetical protein E2R66_27350 [Mucilaginibacter psychrotolerans]